ncbi:hypothetical protein [Cytobacillus firmus]|uniref:hypothetical protein n=1 Tax=Cytobacillus firmus TaxID=1399 RepID=UPI0034A57DC9
MELKEIILHDATNRQKKNEVGFNLQTNVFSLIVSRYLQGALTDEVESLMVYCLADMKETIVDSYTIENGLTIKIPYNPKEFLDLRDPEEKYIEYCRVFNEFISPVFQEKSWNYTPVKDALEKIKEHKYSVEFLLKGTPKKSPDKEHTAYAVGVHTVTSFKLMAKIYHKSGLMVKEEVLVEEVPSHVVYGRFLGKPEWVDNRTFQVASKTSQWVGVITI